jgi:hypothetical protein
MVPVAPEVDGIERDHHHVARARCDLLLATGTHVGFRRLVRLDAVNLERFAQRGISAHSRRRATTMNAAATST